LQEPELSGSGEFRSADALQGVREREAPGKEGIVTPPQPASPSPSLGAGIYTNVPRLSLSKQEAAAALGMSEDSFDRYVRAHVPCVRRGRLRLYSLRDLEQWLQANAELALEEAA
jgi:hypothetical protein